MSNELDTLIAELRKQADAATPGPWENDCFETCSSLAGPLNWVSPLQNDADDQPLLAADAAFIAAARTLVPALLDALELAITQRDSWATSSDWWDPKKISDDDAQLAAALKGSSD